MHLSIAALQVLAATPMPVYVVNPPLPDKIATDTLYYARATFYATVILGFATIIVGGLAARFAWFDYTLTRELSSRLPKLTFSFNGAPTRDFTTQVHVSPALSNMRVFDVEIVVHNIGRARAHQVVFDFTVPLNCRAASGGPVPMQQRADDQLCTFTTTLDAVYVGVPQTIFWAKFIFQPDVGERVAFHYAVRYENIDVVEGGPQSGRGTIGLVQ